METKTNCDNGSSRINHYYLIKFLQAVNQCLDFTGSVNYQNLKPYSIILSQTYIWTFTSLRILAPLPFFILQDCTSQKIQMQLTTKEEIWLINKDWNLHSHTSRLLFIIENHSPLLIHIALGVSLYLQKSFLLNCCQSQFF